MWCGTHKNKKNHHYGTSKTSTKTESFKFHYRLQYSLVGKRKIKKKKFKASIERLEKPNQAINTLNATVFSKKITLKSTED